MVAKASGAAKGCQNTIFSFTSLEYKGLTEELLARRANNKVPREKKGGGGIVGIRDPIIARTQTNTLSPHDNP